MKVIFFFNPEMLKYIQFMSHSTVTENLVQSIRLYYSSLKDLWFLWFSIMETGANGIISWLDVALVLPGQPLVFGPG